ncbi:EAL domain-containing protein [Hyphomicrobium sp. CS1GBMeth3]|uniref:putative bifunctional diguanylate cyclase/phosphodiesterase n=1 Tax=Hyphomicrobium sp. CS1GBMeth3 TaxID=1892845 RepID=UPI000930341A|nr:EAL domain-containing protein [Hyphomicrobium sp. CS1GBMeth3]
MRTLAIGSVLTVVSAAVLVLGVALWSAIEADNVAKNRLFQIVGYAVKTSAEKISYDQESVAYWDDAVTNTRDPINEEWVDVNLGVWMHDYFKHDRVALLDAVNRPRYAMVDGKKGPLDTWTSSEVITRLATQVRDRIATGALTAYEAGKMRIPRAQDTGFVEGRPAVVSVMVLVPHSDAVVQERGTERLIASVRFLDSSFLQDLAQAYLLDGVRFSRSGKITTLEQSYPLKTEAGEILGSFVWVPDLPGRGILAKVLPVMAAGLAGIGLAIWFLIRRLGRAYTELMSSEAQAKHLAFHDTLTGLANRAYFNERLEMALAEIRNGGGQLALMFLDLDRFKQVNDSLGHAAGDALIRDLAAKLKSNLRPGDTLARIGGDEFAIVMRDMHGRHEVEALCRNIVAAATAPFDVLGGQARVGISIGVAVAPGAGLDRSELARKADIALYQAKRNGGLGFEFFSDDMSHAVQQRRELETALGRALASGSELDVVFQPLFCADRLTVTGVEALLRWYHPRMGSISPYTFISIAEDCGLINPLGDFVLRRACTAARAWELDRVSVNVSPIQLRQADFAERVLLVLDDVGMPPDQLEIEITESSLIGCSDISTRNLTTLRNAGVKLALDDFGTGYSSLSYLMRLEVDRIKIDRSFVHAIGESAQSNSIIQAIVTMAHAVGVSVTAEGVETRQQQEFLIAVGCDDLQGHLLSHPVSALRMVELLATKRNAQKSSDIEAA